MSEDPQQAATDTPEPTAEPVVEAGTGEPEDNLDALLAEFDQEKQQAEQPAPPPEQKDDEPSGLEDRIKYLEDLQFKGEVTGMVDTVKKSDDRLSDLSDRLVQSWLDGEVRHDKDLMHAFVNRTQNPAAFDKVLAKLGEGLANELAGRPDPQLTADQTAARTAVRGVSTALPESTTPTNEELSKMSDAQIEKLARGG